MRTICVVGFPAEVSPRELKNLTRFMTGFEGAHVAFAGPGQSSALFVKFVSPEIARNAMDMLHGAPFDMDNPQIILKVEYARREMEVRPNSLLPTQMAALTTPMDPMMEQPPPQPLRTVPATRSLPPVTMQDGMLKRIGLTGGELTTVTVLGMKEKGWSAEELVPWFQQRPGFLTLHVNERIDGLFVKFGSGSAAERAIEDANQHNFGAEWARRNLDDDIGPQRQQLQLQQQQQLPPPSGQYVDPQYGDAGAQFGEMNQMYPTQQPMGQPMGGQPMGGQPMGAPMVQQQMPPPAGGAYSNAAKRQRSNLGELSTITILGIRDKDLSPEMLQQWFSQKPGFVAMQVNERINGVFAKFATQAQAVGVLEEANAMQWGAEWARRNLDL